MLIIRLSALISTLVKTYLPVKVALQERRAFETKTMRTQAHRFAPLNYLEFTKRVPKVGAKSIIASEVTLH